MTKKRKTPPARKHQPVGAPQPEYPWLRSYPEGVAWDMPLKGRPMGQILDDSAARYGPDICSYFLGKTLTYAEIGAHADRIARGLQDMGVGKGVKVGLMLPNCPAYIVFFFGIVKTGATVVNFNPLYTVEELEHQIKDSQTGILVTLDLRVLFEKVEALISGGALVTAIVCPFADMLPGLKSVLFRLFKARQRARPERSSVARAIVMEGALSSNDGTYRKPRIDPEKDIAVLQYTGGTTGTPKGAMLTHTNLSVNIEQVRAWATNLYDGKERFMGILPFFHVFAMTTVMNFGVSTGCRLILMPKFELEDALKLIDRTKPTVLPGVPTLYNAMLNHPQLDRYDLSSLKFCISGSAALPIEVKRRFESLTGCKLVEGYGLSETAPVATCNPVEGTNKEGSIGIPVPGTTVSIRDIDDPRKELPLGKDGEICVAGPQVMPGYWNKPEETRDAFVGEFFRTGDVGHMDNDGFIFIVDRLKDMINVSGFKVYPRRIEEAIYAFPAVEEATVIGVPDDYSGEAPKAFIKLKAGHTATADEILAFLKQKISKLEMPGEIEFRNELPKTMIGKLSKKELRAEAGTQSGSKD